MNTSSGELPNQIRINGSEDQLTLPRLGLGFRNVVQNPFDLWSGEIGVGNQTRGFLNVPSKPLGLEPIDDSSGPPALPSYRVVDGLAIVSIPNNSRLSLVSDSDCSNALAVLPYEPSSRADLSGPKIHGILLSPSRLRVNLLKLTLHSFNYLAIPIEQDRARARSPLIER